MKVVTARDFRDHATEMFRSDDVILVTHEGTSTGFFLPWDKLAVRQRPATTSRGRYVDVAGGS
jgi:hypothetical protein